MAWFQEAFASPGRDDPYWTRRDFSARVGEVTARVQFIGGWYDILLPWMLDDFEALQAAGRAPQLLIGPWTHISPALAAAGHRDGLAWMRAHLLGDDRLVRPAAVRIMVTGERSGGGWRDLPTWPPPGVHTRSLYLHGAATLGDAPATGEGADGYRYDPAEPTPSLGGPILLARAAVVDNAPLEARPDVLTYTGPVLVEAVEAIGDVFAELWVRADRPHFDIFARVCDVDAEGVSRNVCDALTSVAPHRHEQAPDGSWRVAFRSVADRAPVRRRAPDPPAGVIRRAPPLRAQPGYRRRSGHGDRGVHAAGADPDPARPSASLGPAAARDGVRLGARRACKRAPETAARREVGRMPPPVPSTSNAAGAAVGDCRLPPPTPSTSTVAGRGVRD